MRIFVAFILYFLTVWAYAKPSITVSTYNVVDKNVVTLSDVAKFEDMTDQQKEYLSTIELGQAPESGKQIKFTRVALSSIFRKYLSKLNQEGVALQIPEAVVVEGVSFQLPKADVEFQLLKFMSEKCSDCELRIQNLILPVTKNIDKHSSYKIKLPTEMFHGPFNLAVEIMEPNNKNSGIPQTFWIRGDMHLFKKVPVANRSLSPGDRVQASDFKIELKDVTFFKDNSPDQEKVLGVKIRRTLAANQIIGFADIEREVACKAGEVVQILAGGMDWSVSVNGLAKENGFVGDMIKVMNPVTNKLMNAVVKDKGAVVLQ